MFLPSGEAFSLHHDGFWFSFEHAALDNHSQTP